MIRLSYLLLLASISIYSCASKKYGRHFQNQIENSQTFQKEYIIDEEPQLIASLDNDLSINTPELKATHIKVPVLEQIPSLGKIHKDSSMVSKQDNGNEKLKKSERDRRLEPFGIGAFGLFVITSLIGISTGFTPLLFVLFGISMVAGLFSVHRISINKKRWKGRFFGYFVVIAGLTLLALLGISAFIEAAFGST